MRRLVLALVALSLPVQAQPFSVVEATIDDIQAQYASGALSPQDVVMLYLARIKHYDQSTKPQPFTAKGDRQLQPLNSFIYVNDHARTDAHALNGQAPAGRPLFGIPVILKDNIATFDQPTTAGSVALGASRPGHDATIADKLRAAGAIILGKGSLTEYANFIALGMPTGFSSQLRYELFQVPGADVTKVGYGFNAYDPRIDPRPVAPVNDGRPVLQTGGSSSGPGIAVGASLATVGVGTETSGSILSPSGQNSDVGIKPTLGLVSRHGVLPITEDQDTAGPIARTVTDAAKLLGVLAGFDAKDPATQGCLTPGNCFSDYTQFLNENALNGAHIAVPKHPYWAEFGLGAARTQLMNDAIAVMTSLGATVEECEIPSQNTLNVYGTCVTTGDVDARRATPAGTVPPCSTVLLWGFHFHLNDFLADPDFGPWVSDSNAQIPVRTIHNLDDIIDYNAAASHPNNPEVQMKYGQAIALGAQYLGTQPSKDAQDYQDDRALDLKLTRDCGFDVLYTGVMPADCAQYVSSQGSCAGKKFDATIFPANFGANAPARAGYPSVIVPAGFFPNPAAASIASFDPGFNPKPSPFGVTFSGPAFSEPKLIGYAYAYEQATHHRVPPSSTP